MLPLREVLANKWFRVGVAVFIALLIVLFVAKPKSLGRLLTEDGFRFKRTDKRDETLPESRDAGFYMLSKTERVRLIDRLRKFGFEEIPDPDTIWFERSFRYFPPRSEQQVFFSPDGPTSEVEFAPDIKP